AGCTGPPITSRTVPTTVPVAARGCSQSRKAVRVDGPIAYVPHASQTLWNTKTTQPPPAASAPVTACWRSASVVVETTSATVRMAKRVGGRDGLGRRAAGGEAGVVARGVVAAAGRHLLERR